jgi:hypothetical protein
VVRDLLWRLQPLVYGVAAGNLPAACRAWQGLAAGEVLLTEVVRALFPRLIDGQDVLRGVDVSVAENYYFFRYTLA